MACIPDRYARIGTGNAERQFPLTGRSIRGLTLQFMTRLRTPADAGHRQRLAPLEVVGAIFWMVLATPMSMRQDLRNGVCRTFRMLAKVQASSSE